MDNHAAKVIKSFHSQAYMTRSDPTSKFATGDEPGRSDLLVAKNGFSACVEIKSANMSFSFSNWRENQRRWASEWCEVYNNVPYWIWLNVGGNAPNAKVNPLRAWLIPKHKFLQIETKISDYQDSIPYEAGKGYNLKLQELQYDCIHLFEDHEVFWQKGCFYIPSYHPFRINFEGTYMLEQELVQKFLHKEGWRFVKSVSKKGISKKIQIGSTFLKDGKRDITIYADTHELTVQKLMEKMYPHEYNLELTYLWDKYLPQIVDQLTEDRYSPPLVNKTARGAALEILYAWLSDVKLENEDD